jgi:hypothetical protein
MLIMEGVKDVANRQGMILNSIFKRRIVNVHGSSTRF